MIAIFGMETKIDLRYNKGITDFMIIIRIFLLFCTLCNKIIQSLAKIAACWMEEMRPSN